MDEWTKKRSGQIPAFGNWDLSNELPITQYFECARQAGLVRYSNSSSSTSAESDLYALHNFHKPLPAPYNNIPHSALKHKQVTRNKERRCPHGANGMVKKKDNMNVMTRKQGKVYDVTEQPRKPVRISKQLRQHDTVPLSPPPRPPKPVDEDLYKIPPELLHTSKRKKMLGFISKCFVPAACVS